MGYVDFPWSSCAVLYLINPFSAWVQPRWVNKSQKSVSAALSSRLQSRFFPSCGNSFGGKNRKVCFGFSYIGPRLSQSSSRYKLGTAQQCPYHVGFWVELWHFSCCLWRSPMLIDVSMFGILKVCENSCHSWMKWLRPYQVSNEVTWEDLAALLRRESKQDEVL